MARELPNKDAPVAQEKARWLFRLRRKPRKGASKPDRSESEVVEIALDDELRKRAFSDPQSFT